MQIFITYRDTIGPTPYDLLSLVQQIINLLKGETMKKLLSCVLVLLIGLSMVYASTKTITFETGKTIDYYPIDVETLSFKDHTPLPLVCGIKKIEGSSLTSAIYEIRINCAMLTNATATGTYSADVCYYLKKGDEITMKVSEDYIDTPIKMTVKSITWNKCVFEVEDKAKQYASVSTSEDSF